MNVAPSRLFLYGTLMPGHRAWPMLAPHARDARPAHAPGVLYDTGRGYPGACFDEVLRAGTSLVHGVVVTLDDAASATVLARLDRYEGPAYRRVVVRLDDGDVAHAYDWIGPRRDLRVLDDGRWPKPG